MFSQIELDHSVPMLVKMSQNMCSAKTHYINRQTYQYYKRVTSSSYTGQLTDMRSDFAVTCWYLSMLESKRII